MHNHPHLERLVSQSTAVLLMFEGKCSGLRAKPAHFVGHLPKPTEVMPNRIPRTYLVAGTQEPFFLENATRWAAALRDAGADVVMKERTGSHGGAFWRKEFPLMVVWAFGRE